MALTDIAVRKLKAKDKPYKVSDGGGLFLWVTPSGGKLWRWSYRFERKQKLMTFGKYPDVPLALARERHMEGRKLLATGIDPMSKRNADKVAEQIANENSFAQVAKRWLEHWSEGKAFGTWTQLGVGCMRISFLLWRLSRSPASRLRIWSPWFA